MSLTPGLHNNRTACIERGKSLHVILLPPGHHNRWSDLSREALASRVFPVHRLQKAAIRPALHLQRKLPLLPRMLQWPVCKEVCGLHEAHYQWVTSWAHVFTHSDLCSSYLTRDRSWQTKWRSHIDLCCMCAGLAGAKYISFEERQWHSECFTCTQCSVTLVGRGFLTQRDNILCTDCGREKWPFSEGVTAVS